jgi:hypothetical protein
VASSYIRARASKKTRYILPTNLAVLPRRSSRIAYITGKG